MKNNCIYTSQNLLTMLDIAISQLIENEDCSLCKLYNRKDERCLIEDNCRNYLFDGLCSRALNKI